MFQLWLIWLSNTANLYMSPGLQLARIMTSYLQSAVVNLSQVRFWAIKMTCAVIRYLRCHPRCDCDIPWQSQNILHTLSLPKSLSHLHPPLHRALPILLQQYSSAEPEYCHSPVCGQSAWCGDVLSFHTSRHHQRELWATPAHTKLYTRVQI